MNPFIYRITPDRAKNIPLQKMATAIDVNSLIYLCLRGYIKFFPAGKNNMRKFFDFKKGIKITQMLNC